MRAQLLQRASTRILLPLWEWGWALRGSGVWGQRQGAPSSSDGLRLTESVLVGYQQLGYY